MVENVNNISLVPTAASTKASTKSRVLSAIKDASARTGVDFAYLVNKAAQESSFNPEAKSSRSSATGLFQFIDQTWLKTIKENGEECGLGDMADKITIGSNGVATVASEADKKQILALRKNPEVSALMAAELAKDNKEALEKKIGGKVGATEMYLAHFLGSGGASNLLSTLKTNPDANAAELLPQAAQANKSVFYDSDTGAAKSVSEIYQKFAQKFNKAPDLRDGNVQVASASTTSATASAIQSAQNVEKDVATNITLASISKTASSSNMSLANGATLSQSTTSSPFATMVLAQMDMETFGLDAKDYVTKMGSNDDARRKNVLSTLANAA